MPLANWLCRTKLARKHHTTRYFYSASACLFSQDGGGGGGGGFFLACEDFEIIFDYSFPAYALFSFFFLKWRLARAH